MLLYATTDQLTTWAGTPAPGNAAALLRSASLMVRGATRAAVYPVQANGMPVDDDLVDAMRDATCAQAAMWAANGIDPNTAGLNASVPIRSGIGSASVEFDTTVAGSAAGQQIRADLATQLCADAVAILTDAGLLSGQPVLFS